MQDSVAAEQQDDSQEQEQHNLEQSNYPTLTGFNIFQYFVIATVGLMFLSLVVRFIFYSLIFGLITHLLNFVFKRYLS